uniref:ARAD1C13728p n=1 Tax=Blastobotrys adeninivorans TaxID=409370 RepID=A0A060T149_BLAAD
MAKLDKPKPKGKSTVTSDERFAGVHSDPRFRLPGKKHIKGTIDDRFKDVIAKDERFQDKVIVDKYGRKIKKSNKKELKKYYHVDEDEEKPKEESEDSSSGDDKKVSDGSDDGSESEESSDESDSESEEFDPARGKGVSSSESSDESSSESESESEDEEDDEQVELDPEVAARQKKDPIPMGEETSRFAVVNMDWDNIRAVDLMATLSSFVPPRGRIESVRIYPSEYGKMRMAKEEVEGPSREFFSKKKKGKKSRAEEQDEEEINEKTIVKEDKGEEVDSSTLRKYQLQRLQYYYAVVECDSKVTARNIYDNVDGTEYESTANFFDLRYIPEGMDFDDKPRDECTKIPADYKPNAFVTDALQHSKVKLTWDETPTERLKLASKAFSQKEIDDMDFKAYLASDSESDAEELKSKYQSLLGGVLGSKEDDLDMEITFTPGGGDNDQAEESESGEETTIEKYRRKEKERRKRRMEKLKAKKEEDEPATGLTKKEEEAKKAAELELLAMDDETPLTNNTTTTTTNKKSKGKMSKKMQAAEEAEAEVDTSDPRFQALFDNPEFAIDTTAPQFKKTKAMSKLQEERRKRVKSGDDSEPVKKRKKVSSGGDDLQSLVSKLKQRAKK